MKFENIENIAYLGPEASFSEMAADVFCEKHSISARLVPLKTAKDIVNFIEENPKSLGVLPVENSLNGTLRESFDSILASKSIGIKILSEIIMPIEYCLLSRTTEFYSITGVIGTPYLFGKCQDFLKNEMPLNLNIIEAPSMTEAAKNLSNYNLMYSSVGNKKVAETFRLNILKSNISDDKTNKTRYVLIGDYDTPVTSHDKTTVAFAINNEAGALLEVLKVFLEDEINITYMSSHPSKYNMDEYGFIVNFDGHIHQNNILNVINKIKPKTTYLRFLGSYEKNSIY